MTLAMFLPITKVDAVNHLVYGIATEERPDRAREIFDYAKSKPYYEKWSKEISEATDGKSLGNVRAMHSKLAVGKLTELTFNDEHKRVEVCAKIVDENEWNKVVEGIYTGFSQGGDYVDRYTDPVDPTLKRYVARPTELSLVDLPCLPTATFQLIKSAGAVSEVEVRAFRSMSNEAGIQEAFEKFFDPNKGFWSQVSEAAETEKLTSAEIKARIEGKGDKDKEEAGESETEEEAEGEGESEDGAAKPKAKAKPKVGDGGRGGDGAGEAEKGHQPGRRAAVSESEKPSNSDRHVGNPGGEGGGGRSGRGNPPGPSIEAGGGEHPSSEHVDPGGENEDEDGTAHTHEPKTLEGNKGESQEETSRQLPSSIQETRKGVDRGNGLDTALESLKQVWLAKDGKPFAKKVDALAYNKELETQELAKAMAEPADKAIAELTAALDRVDGGDVKITDMQAFERVRQEVMRSTQTRAGASPLGKIYNSVDDLPPAVKSHFKDATKQRQWMHVWNTVFKESGDETKAFAQAWSAAQKALTEEELEKVEALKKSREYADPGFQKDKKPRYPLDTEANIKASWAFVHMPKNVSKYSTGNLATIRQAVNKAWHAKIGGDLPVAGRLEGSELVKTLGQYVGKHLYDVGQIANTILSLYDLKTHLEMEAIVEGDSMDSANELHENIASLCRFLRNLVEEETQELVEGTEDLTAHDDEEDGGDVLVMFARAAVGPNALHMAKLFQEAFGRYEDEEVEKAAKKGLKYHKAKGVRLIEALEKAGRRIGQVNRMHLQSAHDHVAAMSDGAVCGGDEMEMAGAKLSRDTMDKLGKIHDHMSDLGADCSMGKSALLRSTDEEIVKFEKSAGLGEGSLEKIVEQNAALQKALLRVTDTVKGLTDRIHRLEKEPEPARGFKKIMPGARVVEKSQDMAVIEFAQDETGLRGEDALDAFNKYLQGLTPEAQARELIKISLRNPVIRTMS